MRHISKSFGRVHAVRDISFEIGTGEVVGLLGPNGAGKSTTIRMLTGYINPDHGSVEIGGASHTDGLRARWMMGYLPESAPTYPEMRVIDFLHYRGRLYNMRRGDRVRAISHVAKLCWLTDVLTRRTGVLSKGYRQRVALAAALLHSPKVLILDEPSNGLDPSQIRETRDLIRELGQERTMIVSSHILPEIERTCDRLLIISDGQLRADGTPAELTRERYGAGLVVADLRTNANACTSVLLAEPGIRNVRVLSSDGGWTRVEVRPEAPNPATGGSDATGNPRGFEHESGANDLNQRLGRIASEQGWQVRELAPQNPSLERVFFDLVDPYENGERAGHDPSHPAPSTDPSEPLPEEPDE